MPGETPITRIHRPWVYASSKPRAPGPRAYSAASASSPDADPDRAAAFGGQGHDAAMLCCDHIVLLHRRRGTAPELANSAAGRVDPRVHDRYQPFAHSHHVDPSTTPPRAGPGAAPLREATSTPQPAHPAAAHPDRQVEPPQVPRRAKGEADAHAAAGRQPGACSSGLARASTRVPWRQPASSPTPAGRGGDVVPPSMATAPGRPRVRGRAALPRRPGASPPIRVGRQRPAD
jgi:hypothetical protein